MGDEICSLEELDHTETSCGIKHPDGHFSGHDIEDVKPYLRPMSSMTEEERNEYFDFRNQELQRVALAEVGRESTIAEISDWLNAHHFDYRGLIPMGLALEAPKDMYKTE